MRRYASLALFPLALAFAGCQRHAGHEKEAEIWAVTSWGERFEIFAEVAPLVAGQASESHTHVTILEGFAPLKEGSVAAILRGGGKEEVFRQDTAERDGIFGIAIKPTREGTFDLVFRVETKAAREDIPTGRVRVGSAAQPGRLAEPPPPRSGPVPSDAAAADEVTFLKEQQWRTEFATAWVEEGAVQASVRGPGRVRPSGSGEASLTASVDALVAPAPWPYPGQVLPSGATVFRLVPREAGQRSLPQLEGEERALQADRDAAKARIERLEKLLDSEAVSRGEVERARATLVGLEARLQAARRDLGATRAVRQGGSGGAGFPVRAPWNGRVAEVLVTPGQAVAAGTVLARVVKPRPLWIEVSLPAADAVRVRGAIAGVSVVSRPGEPPLLVPGARLVARAPEVDRATGAQTVVAEVDVTTDTLPIGSSVEAALLLPEQKRGPVVPDSAIVEDAGVAVAYVQIGGETFARRPVRVLERQGPWVLVEGLRPGARLVTVGGATIRRAALLSTGAPEGHVH